MGRRSRWTESCFGTPSLTSSRSSTSISRACIESRDGSEVDYYIHQKHLSSKACYWPPYCLRHSLPLTHTTVVYFSFFWCCVYVSVSTMYVFFYFLAVTTVKPASPYQYFFSPCPRRGYIYMSRLLSRPLFLPSYTPLPQ